MHGLALVTLQNAKQVGHSAVYKGRRIGNSNVFGFFYSLIETAVEFAIYAARSVILQRLENRLLYKEIFYTALTMLF